MEPLPIRAREYPVGRPTLLDSGLTVVLVGAVVMLPGLVVVGLRELMAPVSPATAIPFFMGLSVAMYAVVSVGIVAVLQMTVERAQIGFDGIEHRSPDERTFIAWGEVHDVRRVESRWGVVRAAGPPIHLGPQACRRARHHLDRHDASGPTPELVEHLSPPDGDADAWRERLEAPLPSGYRSQPRRDGVRAVLRHPRSAPLARIGAAARLSVDATREERLEMRAIGRACACTRVRRALVELSVQDADVRAILQAALG